MWSAVRDSNPRQPGNRSCVVLYQLSYPREKHQSPTAHVANAAGLTRYSRSSLPKRADCQLNDVTHLQCPRYRPLSTGRRRVLSSRQMGCSAPSKLRPVDGDDPQRLLSAFEAETSPAGSSAPLKLRLCSKAETSPTGSDQRSYGLSTLDMSREIDGCSVPGTETCRTIPMGSSTPHARPVIVASLVETPPRGASRLLSALKLRPVRHDFSDATRQLGAFEAETASPCELEP